MLPEVLIDLIMEYFTLFELLEADIHPTSKHLLNTVQTSLSAYFSVDLTKLDNDDVLNNLYPFTDSWWRLPSQDELPGFVSLILLDRLPKQLVTSCLFKGLRDTSLQVKTKVYPRLITLLLQRGQEWAKHILDYAIIFESTAVSESCGLELLITLHPDLLRSLSSYRIGIIRKNHPSFYDKYLLAIAKESTFAD